MTQPPDIIRQRVLAAGLSVGVGLAMLVIKLGAWLITASTVILSDALESVVHVGATLFMYFCMRWSLRPPDEDHPYGHGRAEHVSVAVEGGMVATTALAVFWAAGRSLWLGPEVHEAQTGLWLTAAAAVINLLLGFYLLDAARRTRSGILMADARHVLSDVWTSVAAIGGLAAVWATGLQILDPLVAIVLGTVVLFTGVRLARGAVSGLMDAADTELLTTVVDAINDIRQPDWIDCHKLRVRVAGDLVYVDFHLVVPAEWTVEQAHAAIERLEQH
ncbi:MAG: cation transporter, partial [Planctomycetes bacterium]|nr:cation transporter [Planctomycetota bacterium]